MHLTAPIAITTVKHPFQWLVQGMIILALAALIIAAPALAADAPAETAAETEGFPTAFDDSFEEEFDQTQDTIADPLEPFNRVMFKVNDKLIIYVLKPVSKTYSTVVPWEIRTVLGNFFYNLAAPARLVNNLLQGKVTAAGAEFGRFFINTTVGVLGFGDPAATFPRLNPPVEDMGQTFGVWGVGDGVYIVLPILGPSTLRDTVGTVGDWLLDPFFYTADATAGWIAISAVRQVNRLSYGFFDQYEALKEVSIDPYKMFQSVYLQHRREQLAK